MKIAINISGHKLSDIATKHLKEYAKNIIDIPVPNADLDDLEPYVAELMEILKKSKHASKAILTNEYILVIPGHAAIAYHIAAALHGGSGSFPTFTFTVRTDDGTYDIATPIDLNTIRLKYRDFFRA